MAPPDPADAPWGLFARLVMVMAVAAGLALLIAPLCRDGMAMPLVTGPASAPVVVTAGHDPGAMPPLSGGSCAAMAASDRAAGLCDRNPAGLVGSPGGAPAPGGVLQACVAVVIAIAAVMLGLRPPWSGRVAVTRRTEPSHRIGVVPGRCPTLAELCVLRT